MIIHVLRSLFSEYIIVPSLPPSNVTSSNLTSTSSSTLKWGPIPRGYINGLLIGYRIKYTLTMSSENEVDEADSITIDSGPGVLSIQLQGLQANSVYMVTIAGVNDVGVGPEDVVYIGNY